MEQQNDREILTYSRATEWRVCHYREFLRYELGLQSRSAKPALRFGDLWHRLMEAVYLSHRAWEDVAVHPDYAADLVATPPVSDDIRSTVLEGWTAPEWTKLDAVPAALARSLGVPEASDPVSGVVYKGVLARWLREMRAKVTPAVDEDDPGDRLYEDAELFGMAAMAQDMLVRYLARWWDLDWTRYEVLLVEAEYRVPLRTAKGNASIKWQLAGKLDVVVRERVSRRVVVIEHKTTAYAPERALEDISVDPQGIGYVHLLHEAGLWSDPEEVGGVLYRVSRKKVPSPPKRNKCDANLSDGVVVDHALCGICGGTGEGEPGRPTKCKGKKADGVVGGDHANCVLCGGTGEGELSKPLKCKGKKSDGVVEDHSACSKCHGTELGPVSESECDTMAEVYEATLIEAEQTGFMRTPKHEAILVELEGRGSDNWLMERERAVQPRDLARWSLEMYMLSLEKNAAQGRGEAGHCRAGHRGACRQWGTRCGFMELCERNEADSLAAWKTDLYLQQLYELRGAHEELDRGEDDAVSL